MSNTDEKIFIVDDDPSVRKSLMRLMRTAGWKVEGHASASEFLARLPIGGRGCAILDLTLPDSSGLELADQMVAQGCSLPVIFVTGGSDSVLRQMAKSNRNVNCVAYFTKPVDAEMLLNAVRLAFECADLKLQSQLSGTME
jgi:FixJ family two-component response regulator